MEIDRSMLAMMSPLRSDNFLEHYGVPRRSGRYPYGSGENPYQRTGRGSSRSNSSDRGKGSGTSNNLSKKQRRLDAKTKKMAAKAEKKRRQEEAKKEAAQKQAATEREKILKNPRLLYKNRDKFTDKEIKDALAHFNVERQLRDISKNELRRGKEIADLILDYADTGIKAYNTGARVMNSLFIKEADSKLPYIENPKGNKDKKKKKDDDD